MEKIQMTTPLVEMDGDEMTRILWKMIKDELLLPFIDLNTEYYDLGRLMPPKQLRNMVLQLNVRPSHRIMHVWTNMISRRCTRARTVRFVRFLTEPYSVHRSL